MTPIGLIYVAILFIYTRLLRNRIQRVFENSLVLNPTERAFRRSTLLAILFGFGFIGVEGFSLPVPFLLAILTILAMPKAFASLLVGNLIGFAVSWLVLFVGFMVREHHIDRSGARLRRRRFDPQPLPKWHLVVAISVAVALAIPMFLNRQRSAQRVEIRMSLLPYAESIHDSVMQLWRKEGRLLCEGDQQLEFLATPTDSEVPVEIRIEGCGHYVVSALSKDGDEVGKLVLNAEPVEISSGTTLEWDCAGSTYVKSEESYIPQCQSSQNAIYNAANEIKNLIKPVSAYDFLAVDGDGWLGSMRHYDSSNRLISEFEVNVYITILSSDELEFSYSFPHEPHLNSQSRIKLSKNGAFLDGAEIIDRTYMDDGTLRVITLSTNNGDTHSRKVRRTYLISETSFVQQIVTAEKDTEAVRTEYVFDRQ